MSDDHDSWFSSIGVDIGKLRDKGAALVQNVETETKAWVDQKVADVKSDVQRAEDWAKQEYDAGKKLVADEIDSAKKWADNKVDQVKQEVASVKQTVVGDRSGKAVPRPMEQDCKPVRGKVPGPKNHIYCGTHGHVLDTDTQQIIAASIGDYVKAAMGKDGRGAPADEPYEGEGRNDDGSINKKPGGHGKKRPKDSKRAQDKPFDEAVRDYGLTPDEARELHDEIGGQGYGRDTIRSLAKDIRDRRDAKGQEKEKNASAGEADNYEETESEIGAPDSALQKRIKEYLINIGIPVGAAVILAALMFKAIVALGAQGAVAELRRHNFSDTQIKAFCKEFDLH